MIKLFVFVFFFVLYIDTQHNSCPADASPVFFILDEYQFWQFEMT